MRSGKDSRRSRSLTLAETRIDNPTARGNAALAGLADKHPVSQKTAVHQINPLIGGDLAHHRVPAGALKMLSATALHMIKLFMVVSCFSS